ncbi:Cytochrome bd-II ubiquinol oxidase subunit 1 [Candidatus Izimaplasma bacterium HR1]|jgi:cytochrome d ubiquinol oxidase subunit I|uniref:cytochrome ubiquinol oxidase subunit I n=1 Tax=Candidatus Izimoplasma sp. HR1 TaxID=1541959 RepID=UPI0004F631B9|nr:Cytochrome bd-II ubiquinol oxidase subunit 1 [Candidatus Izimaplasma bacterium HR1]
MIEILSRVQFAFTIAFHFIFVPLTVGLIIMILIFEIRYYRKGDERFKKLSNYFSDIFLINYAFGIVTGIAMTIQFGTNWAGYSYAMGEVFGSPLILEAIIAFFLESTFNGIWLFRRNRLSKKLRLTTVSMITLGTTLSALWIITANGFMQNPVGAMWVGDRMIITNFLDIVLNPYAWYMLIHNHTSAIVLSGFVVLAISSWHLLYGKEKDKELFIISAKYAAWILLISAILMPIIGNSYMNFLTPLQPGKIDMITGAASGGLETVVRIAFGVMVGLGSIFILISLYTVVFFKRFIESPTLQKYYMYLVPLPYIAIITGWMVTEMGRQPWIIYDIMRVSDGISDVPVNQVWFSIISITIFYAILFVMDYALTITRIKKGIIDETGGEDNV